MEGRLSEQHITDPSNTRIEETRRTQTGMEASSDGGQGPEGQQLCKRKGTVVQE